VHTQVTICVNHIAEQACAAKSALAYAQRFQATVTAVYFKLSASEVLRWKGSAPKDFSKQMLANIDEQESDAKVAFELIAQRYDCKVIWRTIEDAGKPIQELLCTDIFFVDQPNDELFLLNESRDFLNSLILETKRPVVMVPKKWCAGLFGKKVLLGWNASPESTHATSDALPFMHAYEQVIVIDILTERMTRSDGSGVYHIQDYLSEKQINNELLVEGCESSTDIPKKLIERANQESVDLIVVGGYGHSRIREIILGGVTDYLIKHSPVPVFFSH